MDTIGPVVEIQRDGLRARLLETWRCSVDGVRYEIPAGFETDFASIPSRRMLGNVQLWALLHDHLYWANGMTRAQADRIMRRAMAGFGVSWWIRWIVWAAVRLGGWVAWRAHRRRDHKKRQEDRRMELGRTRTGNYMGPFIGLMLVAVLALGGCADKTVRLGGTATLDDGTVVTITPPPPAVVIKKQLEK